MENWNWIEALWTLVAVLGIYFSTRNVIDGLQDLKVLRLTNGIETQILRVTAFGATRRDSLRLVIQTIFAAIGILAGIAPNNPNPSLLGIFVGFVFILASGMLTASSIFDNGDRKTLIRLGKELLARDAHVTEG